MSGRVGRSVGTENCQFINRRGVLLGGKRPSQVSLQASRAKNDKRFSDMRRRLHALMLGVCRELEEL